MLCTIENMMDRFPPFRPFRYPPVRCRDQRLHTPSSTGLVPLAPATGPVETHLAGQVGQHGSRRFIGRPLCPRYGVERGGRRGFHSCSFAGQSQISRICVVSQSDVIVIDYMPKLCFDSTGSISRANEASSPIPSLCTIWSCQPTLSHTTLTAKWTYSSWCPSIKWWKESLRRTTKRQVARQR